MSCIKTAYEYGEKDHLPTKQLNLIFIQPFEGISTIYSISFEYLRDDFRQMVCMNNLNNSCCIQFFV